MIDRRNLPAVVSFDSECRDAWIVNFAFLCLCHDAGWMALLLAPAIILANLGNLQRYAPGGDVEVGTLKIVD